LRKQKIKAGGVLSSTSSFLVASPGYGHYTLPVPLIGLKTAIGFSIALLGYKLYDDKAMGITAYGDRSANLVIAEQYLEIRDIRIPYSDLSNLVIYVDEYLGMPKEFYGIHHGGNNKIEFERNGKLVSINYVIKNKQDYDRVSKLVDKIEKNPNLKNHLRKLE
jgi:hypothetical protein